MWHMTSYTRKKQLRKARKNGRAVDFICPTCNGSFVHIKLSDYDSAPAHCPKHDICPTSEKVRYRTKGEAMEGVERLRPLDLRTYKCKCAYWHLSTRRAHWQ